MKTGRSLADCSNTIMIFRARQFEFAFPRPALVMGVVNVTPDSFSDGGHYFDCAAAVAHAEELAAQGADIIDVGGESTRPGAEPVDEPEELRRVIPVVEKLSARLKCPISIDTMKPGVARAALQAGASIVNDVAANRTDGCGQRRLSRSGSSRSCTRAGGRSVRAEPITDDGDRVRAGVDQHESPPEFAADRPERPGAGERIEAPSAGTRRRGHHPPQHPGGLLRRIAGLLGAVGRDDRVKPDVGRSFAARGLLGTDQPRSHIGLALDRVGVEQVSAGRAHVDEDRVVLRRPAAARLRAVVIRPDQFVEERVTTEAFVEQQLAVMGFAVVDVEVQRSVRRQQLTGQAQPRLQEAQVVAAPTLIKRLPLPLRRLVGDLSDKREVLLGLDLKE